jgi:16S rRNA U1498 N3-methylase RsmE
MKPDQRLYIAAPLNIGAKVSISAGQAHYLANVLRLNSGESLLAFNGQDGEWQMELLSRVESFCASAKASPNTQSRI